ncbi:uncharacterized protein LOC135844764 [Planococcus citri]|uniref:uncharacterized protein LOC135844764 n=1 Tax=Planococcus citri TaxID=170843 RepID=UPI0031F8880B
MFRLRLSSVCRVEKAALLGRVTGSPAYVGQSSTNHDLSNLNSCFGLVYGNNPHHCRFCTYTPENDSNNGSEVEEGDGEHLNGDVNLNGAVYKKLSFAGSLDRPLLFKCSSVARAICVRNYQTNPHFQEKQSKLQYNLEPWMTSHPHAIVKTGELTKELENARKIIDNVIIPLTVREYAHKIKTRFPNIEAAAPSDELNSEDTDAGKWIVREKYLWHKILEVGSNDMYVSVILNHMLAEFRKYENISIIDEVPANKFKEWKLNFCLAIAEGLNFANKLAAHPRSEMMNVEEKVVDPYLKMFYDALVG